MSARVTRVSVTGVAVSADFPAPSADSADWWEHPAIPPANSKGIIKTNLMRLSLGLSISSGALQLFLPAQRILIAWRKGYRDLTAWTHAKIRRRIEVAAELQGDLRCALSLEKGPAGFLHFLFLRQMLQLGIRLLRSKYELFHGDGRKRRIHGSD